MATSSTERFPGSNPSGEVIRAIRTRPDRFVLTADGQPDAWIASDVLVDLSE